MKYTWTFFLEQFDHLEFTQNQPYPNLFTTINLNNYTMSNSKKQQNKKQLVMNKKRNNEADIENANLGQNGNNTIYDKNQGNRGQQLNPNQKQDGIITKKQVVLPKPIVKPTVKPKPEIIPNLPSKTGKPSGPRRGNKTPKPTK